MKEQKLEFDTEKSSAKRKSIIVQGVNDSQLENIKRKSSAKDIHSWRIGEYIWTQDIIADRIMLQSQLHSMSYREGGDMKYHILCFDNALEKEWKTL